MKLLVEVTQSTIGVCNDPLACMLAIAIRRAFNDDGFRLFKISVHPHRTNPTGGKMYITNCNTYSKTQILLPPEANEAANKFDFDQEVKPFKFELELPSFFEKYIPEETENANTGNS